MLASKFPFVLLMAMFSVVCAKSATVIRGLGYQKSAEDSDGSREVENNGKIPNRENSLNGMANGNGNYVGHNGNIFLNIFNEMFVWKGEEETSATEQTTTWKTNPETTETTETASTDPWVTETSTWPPTTEETTWWL